MRYTASRLGSGSRRLLMSSTTGGGKTRTMAGMGEGRSCWTSHRPCQTPHHCAARSHNPWGCVEVLVRSQGSSGFVCVLPSCCCFGLFTHPSTGGDDPG